MTRVLIHLATLAIAARNGRGQGISIIHKGDLATKVKQAQEVLGLARQFYDEAEEQIQRLANHYRDVTNILGQQRKWFSKPEHRLIDNLSEYVNFKLSQLKTSNGHGHG